MAFGNTSSFSRSFKSGERPLVITSASQIPNLEVWYSADTTSRITFGTSPSVSRWDNAGGLTSHPLDANNGNLQPEWFNNIQNGKGVIRFNSTTIGTPTGEDGDNDERLVINPIGYLQSLSKSTLVILFRSLSTASGIRYATSTDAGGFQWGQNGTQWIGGFAGGVFSVDGITADTNFHYIVLTFDGTQTGNANRLKARLDGQDISLTFSANVNAATNASAGYFYSGCTGTTANNVSNFFIGDLGEVLIWTKALTVNEILAVESYLSNKWAI